MDPNGDQVKAFGDDARRRRKAARMSATDVARAISDSVGRTISRQSVEAWERGEYGPRDAEAAAALDALLDANGELLGLLVAEDAGTLSERVSRIEDRLDRQERQLDEILAALRAER